MLAKLFLASIRVRGSGKRQKTTEILSILNPSPGLGRGYAPSQTTLSP